MRVSKLHPAHPGEIIPIGNNGLVREVAAEISPLKAQLPTVEIEDEEDEMAADAACQLLLDEQKNLEL